MKIEIEGVSFGYGPTAQVLGDLDLVVQSGEHVGLVGPNGSGKSTLLSLILGLLRPRAGQVSVDDDDVHALGRREVARRIALVPQETVVGFPFTVREIVAMGRFPHASRFGADSTTDIEAVDRALADTDLEALAGRRWHELSGGERQRTLIAAGLAQEAAVLLLDEPTASLDLRYRVEVLHLVRRLSAEGRTIVSALHDLDLAARFCDRIAILHQGRILAAGPPAEVLTAARVEAVWETPVRVTTGPFGSPMVVPGP